MSIISQPRFLISLRNSLIGCALLFSQGVLSADDSLDPASEPAKGEGDLAAWSLNKHSVWSADIERFGLYVDSLMGNKKSLRDSNQSYATLEFLSAFASDEKVQIKPRLRLHLDLPATKERLRILIETDSDRARRAQRQNNVPIDRQNDDFGLQAALRYLGDSKDWTRLSLDYGIDIRSKIDPFIRAQAIRTWNLGSKWRFTYDQELSHYRTRGLGSNLRLEFNRRLDERLLLRSTSYLDWNRREQRTSWLQQFSLFRDIDESRVTQYAIGRYKEQIFNRSRIDYFAQFTYRKRLYKDWLFMDTTPGVRFREVRKHRPSVFFILRVEALFTGSDEIKLTPQLYHEDLPEEDEL